MVISSIEMKPTNGGNESDLEWILPVSIATLAMIMYATNIGLLAKLRR